MDSVPGCKRDLLVKYSSTDNREEPRFLRAESELQSCFQTAFATAILRQIASNLCFRGRDFEGAPAYREQAFHRTILFLSIHPHRYKNSLCRAVRL
jgi:hypothetical protein